MVELQVNNENYLLLPFSSYPYNFLPSYPYIFLPIIPFHHHHHCNQTTLFFSCLMILSQISLVLHFFFSYALLEQTFSIIVTLQKKNFQRIPKRKKRSKTLSFHIFQIKAEQQHISKLVVMDILLLTLFNVVTRKSLIQLVQLKTLELKLSRF